METSERAERRFQEETAARFSQAKASTKTAKRGGGINRLRYPAVRCEV
jgi:hypothetical protein